MFRQRVNSATGVRGGVDLQPDRHYVNSDTRSSCVYSRPLMSQCLIVVIYRPKITRCQRRWRGARCYLRAPTINYKQ